MHINELPDVVLARILHYTCNDPANPLIMQNSIETWRPKLVLLAVCRIWRELALPCVHRVSFIQCNSNRPKNRGNSAVLNCYDSECSDEEHSDSESSDTQRNSGALDELGDEMCVVKSNLDIIGNTGNKYWPRTVQMIVDLPNNLIYSLQHMIEKLRSHTILLTKVLRMELEYEESGDIWMSEAAHTIDASSISKEIFQLIPHIRYIKIGSDSDLVEYVDFAQYLVKGYAHQLTGFNCPQFALGKVQSFSDNLKHICMDGNKGTSHMSQICAENLTRLTLKFIKSDFAWSSFESNGRSRGLHFANLKWLSLDVDNEGIDWVTGEMRYFAREFSYKVIAPKLETVALWLCPFTLSFLSSICGLTTVPKVKLVLALGCIYFTEFDLDMARDKFASYAKNSRVDFQTIDDYAYMNDMFNIHRLARSSKVVTEYDDNPLNFERIDWKYILNIEIRCPLHINDLRTLVSNAPGLEIIYVHEVDIKEYGDLLPEIQDETATVELISPSLKSISFDCLIDCTESEVDKFMIYLSKLIPRE